MDVLDSNQRIKTLSQNIECEEDTRQEDTRGRPWRKPGVDISDYFNYGFDEESWKAYCNKQAKLQAEKSSRRKNVKFMAQAAHAGYEEEEPCHACSFSGGQSHIASRESNTNTVMSGGQAGCSSREEVYPCLSDGSNNTQVAAEISCREDSIAACHLPPKVDINTPFAFVPPPPLLFRSGCPPSSPMLPSVHPKGFDGPSTSLYHCCSVTRNMAVSALQIDTAKAWESIRQEKHDNDKDRERGNDERRKRRRRREKPDSSSSDNRGHMGKEKKRWCHRSAEPTENDHFLVGKEEMKPMNSAEHGHKHHRSERDGGDKKKQHKKHQRTSQSSRKYDDKARERRQTQ